MKKNQPFFRGALCLLFSATLFSSCSKEELSPLNQASSSTTADAKVATTVSTFYALTNSNQLVKYNLANQVQETSSIQISGLGVGERILAIDFRPATGQLYGVSNQSRLYVINQNTGATSPIGTQPFTPAINGLLVGFDFNPTVDRIRLVTDQTQNLRLHPETGMVVATDKNLNPGSPTVVAVAYTNSMAGATSTTLYDIDVSTDKLYRQIPPNEGVLVEVGRLNVQAVGQGGFDIAPDNSLALAVLFGRGGGTENQKEDSNGNKYRFYAIDLQTGKATNLGKADRTLIGVAIPTNHF